MGSGRLLSPIPGRARARAVRAASALVLLAVTQLPGITSAGDSSASGAVVHPASTAGGAPGPVVAIGGALRYDHAAVWSRLVALAGGPGARYVVVATASSDPAAVGARVVAALATHGASAEALPVAPELAGTDAQRAARDPEMVERVRRARGVFFTGGAQERIVDTLQPGGEATPLLDAIRELHARGGVIAGTSAGAAAMSGVMFRDATDVIAVMKGSLRPGREVDAGLGFTGEGLLVDQHFLRRGRLGRLLPLMLERGMRFGLGVEEDSAAIVHASSIEIVGAGGALFVDLVQASSDPASGAFNISNARLSFLGDGDRLDLRTRVVTPAPVRDGEGRIDAAAPGFKPHHEQAPYLLDVLGEGAVLRAMTIAVDGPGEVRGLAYDARPDAAPPNDLGFEFRFRRDALTAGWYSSASGTDAYTLAGVRLDVAPVRLARPLYAPWSR
ncbi:MAG: cyanophycinase [Lysobacterales bacterium]|nr:MAG: cyanophycinase [Xanthomonadales bacterium]